MHRLSHLMTSHFGINQLFFLRFDDPRGQDEFYLSKELHLSRQHNLQAASHEHNCRRWISVTLLQELSGSNKPVPGTGGRFATPSS